MSVQPKEPRAQRYRRRLSVAFGPTATATAHTGFTTNLSASGFGIVTKHVHPRGTTLFATLSLPQGEAAKVQCLVAWARRGHDALNLPGSMGVRLLSADEAFFKFLLAASSSPTP